MRFDLMIYLCFVKEQEEERNTHENKKNRVLLAVCIK